MMDCKKIGSLIYELRKDKKMTQKQIADLMNISDKTISKWERGLGCPDISLLPELSQILGVSIDQILSGQINLNDLVGGNMNKLKFKSEVINLAVSEQIKILCMSTMWEFNDSYWKCYNILLWKNIRPTGCKEGGRRT